MSKSVLTGIAGGCDSLVSGKYLLYIKTCMQLHVIV